MKFIDYFGLSIEAEPSRVVKKNVYFVLIGYIPRPLSVKLHISIKIWTKSIFFNHEIYDFTDQQNIFLTRLRLVYILP